MNNSIFLLPVSKYTGVRIVSKSLEYGFIREGIKTSTFHPIFDMDMSKEQISELLLNNRVKEFVELLLIKINEISLNSDVVIINGLFRQSDYTHPLYHLNNVINEFNLEVIKALSSKVIITAYLDNKTLDDVNSELNYFINKYNQKINIIGTIITKVNTKNNAQGSISFSLEDEKISVQNNISFDDLKEIQVIKDKKIELLGAINWSSEISYPRTKDVQKVLKLNCITNVDLNTRVHQVMMCSRRVENFLNDLVPNAMVITSADRSDIIIATCLSAMRGVKISGIILTAEEYLDNNVKKMCVEIAETIGLAIFTTPSRSVKTILDISNLDFMGIPSDDTERLDKVKTSILEDINLEGIKKLLTSDIDKHKIMSPPAFRYHLLQMAKKAKKRIILPESYEPRTLAAAANCHDQGIAECVLIGNKEKISNIAEMNGVHLPENIEIIDFEKTSIDKYLDTLIELRKHKGLSRPLAEDYIKSPMVVANIMLYLGEVDGLVSGAEHTTADVLRPALQLVKTKPGVSLVSSVFFMCMPDEVIVFGDCAVNQDPTAEQLADIALQSAESARQFDIEPRVAMISYSTGSSGTGEDVEKVKKATQIIKQRDPNLLVDGPLQYDAAMESSVAEKKAPNSPVAGKATVLIFPDLNTGNAVYKAVQRSANVLSIGPVLQGMNKPVNDLSRGATIDDITYTIAITAIQAV